MTLKESSGNKNYIDSHVHLDHIFSDNPQRIVWLKQTGGTAVSWSFAKKVKSTSDLTSYFSGHAGAIQEVARTGLPCCYLAGIHPRNITPDLTPENIREMLLPFLDDPLCRGVGEIGLETGSTHEKEILLAQMEMAREVTGRGKVFGIHTPRKNKKSITAQLLSLLLPFKEFGDQIVVDHCNINIIGDVLSMGFYAGVTLSPIKASAEDVMEIIETYEKSIPRIMLNTDSGTRFYKDLFAFIQSADISSDILAMITWSCAESFFGVSESVWK